MSVQEQFRKQADWCKRLDSPLYAELLARTTEEYERGGPVHDLLAPHESDTGWALPLRLMGAVHRIVLEGRAPRLARYYASTGGTPEIEPAWQAFRAAIAQHLDALRPLVEQPVQTNDVNRSGSLLGGFLTIARHTGLPLRLLEVGASAGLNMCWDRFRYEWDGGAWGDAASGVRLTGVFVEGAPPAVDGVAVESRAGCDLHPLDVHAAETRLTLLSYTWADQTARIRLLDQALAIARGVEYRVEQASAADWLEARLEQSHAGAATVVYHSVVWPYLKPEEQARITAAIEQAGARATAQAPLAWLRLEPGADQADLRLRIYPGFEERVIATAGFHRATVKWNG